jgi:endogenous inhibitor of DNA gyrase (YacG/DUF329 family)
MVDLGAWASEAYRVPVAEPPDPDAPEVPPRERPRGGTSS